MRRATVVLALLLAPLGAAPSAGAATLTRVGDAPFPNRAFVLSLPSARSINPSRVDVRENGRPVDGLSVLPATAAGKRGVGTVLVIDASRSMKGRPIAGAMTAARAFAARRSEDQQLGIVTFNATPANRLGLTDDGAAIERALARAPELGRETHVYDAVAMGVRMLRRGGITSGSVVVLSDGADTGSALARGQLAELARDAGVRVFSVGLRSGAYDPDELRALSAAAGGRYSEAGSAADIRRIYDALATELSREYLIRYRSLARPRQRIGVEVSVLGTTVRATSSYSTPSLPANPPPPFEEDFWQTPSALLIVGGGTALLFGIAFVSLLRARPERRSVRARLRDFVSPPTTEGDDARAPRLSQRLLGGAERTLARGAWWDTFKEEVDVARINVSPVNIVLGTVALTTGSMWIVWTLTSNVGFTLLCLAAPFGVRWLIKFKLERERRRFADQLAENLQVIASAMRAGQSFSGALAIAVQDAPEPARREFDRVVSDERLGIPLEDSLAIVVRRMDNRDLEQVQLVATLQRQTGGNMSEVLEQASATIRERGELRRLIRTLTAQGRMSRWVVSALPPALILIISFLNPSYLAPLFHTGTGRLVLLASALMVFFGSYAIKRIVEIKV
jgi:tight adherence protein B